MNSDVALIEGLRQAVRLSLSEFSKAYSDFAECDSGETLRTLVDAQLRMAQKLASLQQLYKVTEEKKIYAPEAEIKDFIKAQKKLEE